MAATTNESIDSSILVARPVISASAYAYHSKFSNKINLIHNLFYVVSSLKPYLPSTDPARSRRPINMILTRKLLGGFFDEN